MRGSPPPPPPPPSTHPLPAQISSKPTRACAQTRTSNIVDRLFFSDSTAGARCATPCFALQSAKLLFAPSFRLHASSPPACRVRPIVAEPKAGTTNCTLWAAVTLHGLWWRDVAQAQLLLLGDTSWQHFQSARPDIPETCTRQTRGDLRVEWLVPSRDTASRMSTLTLTILDASTSRDSRGYPKPPQRQCCTKAPHQPFFPYNLPACDSLQGTQSQIPSL